VAAVQWQSCNLYGEHCEDVVGATSPTYTAITADVGGVLRVVVTAKDAHHSLSQSSPTTQPIGATSAPVIEQQPTITGTDLQGQKLTAGNGTWLGGGSLGYSYQWERCSTDGKCSAIEGAIASSYTLSEVDVSYNMRVVVTATESGRSSITVSGTTATVEHEPLVKFSTPSISGVAQIGGTLTANPGIWSGSGPVTYAYQWKSCNPAGSECAPIEGATESTYTIGGGDLGSTLRVEVTVTNSHGSTSALSSHTAVVPGGELSVEAAQAVAQETDPAVLAPSTTAILEGKAVTPALRDAGEELVSESTLTSSSVSKETPGEFAVYTSSGELAFAPLESLTTATTNATIVNSAAALFTNTWAATDTILRAEPLGDAAILQIRSSEAPHTFSWEARLGAGQQLKQLSDGDVAVINTPEGTGIPGENQELSGAPLTEEGAPETSTEEAEAKSEERESEEVEAKGEIESEVPLEALPAAPTSLTPAAESNPAEPQPQNAKDEYEAAGSTMESAEAETAGQALMVIHAPTVTDAAGESVAADLRVTGDTITMTIDPDSEAVYPALAYLNIAAPTDKVSAERDPPLYGLADDNPETFFDRYGKATINGQRIGIFDPNLQSKDAPLHVQTARLVIPYNVFFTPKSVEAERLKDWLGAVKADGLQPYVTLGPDTSSSCKLKNDECYVPNLDKYRAGIRDLIHNEPGVKLWGSWNEPDLGVHGLHPHEHRAAKYWQVAQYVANHNCSGCKVIAGEFALANRYEGHYISEYKNTIVEQHRYVPCKFCSHARPSIWGFHDYHDVVNDTKAFAEKVTKVTGSRSGKAQMWIGETGVELQSGGAEPTRLAEGKVSEKVREERQVESAEAFESLHKASLRIERIYYYGYRAPTEAEQEEGEKDEKLPFDSGLFEAEPEPAKNEHKSSGEARPVYCVLAFAKNGCAPTVKTVFLSEKGGMKLGDTPEAVVNPNGLVTKLYFQYGIVGEEGYTHTSSSTLVEGIVPTLTGEDLNPPINCNVHYRAVAENADGTSYGQEVWCIVD
jgi:hypothetical protein